MTLLDGKYIGRHVKDTLNRRIGTVTAIGKDGSYEITFKDSRGHPVRDHWTLPDEGYPFCDSSGRILKRQA